MPRASVLSKQSHVLESDWHASTKLHVVFPATQIFHWKNKKKGNVDLLNLRNEAAGRAGHNFTLQDGGCEEVQPTPTTTNVPRPTRGLAMRIQFSQVWHTMHATSNHPRLAAYPARVPDEPTSRDSRFSAREWRFIHTNPTCVIYTPFNTNPSSVCSRESAVSVKGRRFVQRNRFVFSATVFCEFDWTCSALWNSAWRTKYGEIITKAVFCSADHPKCFKF